jgi:hypothetical protein
MGTRLRSWWQQIRKHPVASVFIALLAVVIVLVILGGYKFNWGWTGFNHPSKTLWDWLQLLAALAIPVVVGFGAVWFTTRQGKVADAENTDNQRETALQAYLDKMSELLLDKDNPLRESKSEDVVRSVAQARTLTVFYGLDPVRKASVLRFLSKAGLTEKGKSICIELAKSNLRGTNLFRVQLPLVNLYQSDLREVDLYFANLYKAELGKADLRKASLYKAILIGTKLQGADLREADLREAEQSRANLKGAKITPEQLDQAKSLQGATMPDGSIHD